MYDLFKIIFLYQQMVLYLQSDSDGTYTNRNQFIRQIYDKKEQITN